MAVAQGKTSQTGHTGPDGSTMVSRITKYGSYTYIGENIAYGSTGGEQIVLDLIVDDGVPDRGHRVNIFDKNYKHLGSSASTH